MKELFLKCLEGKLSQLKIINLEKKLEKVFQGMKFWSFLATIANKHHPY
jgi:hypothetical protein